MPDEYGVELVVNGEPRRYRPGDPATLVDFLRERLGLTGTKLSCGAGFCGACTVLVDGAAVSSCSVFVADLPGARVTTIEGLSTGDALHPVQAAFAAEAGFQCGFCTPGMVMSTVALLAVSNGAVSNGAVSDGAVSDAAVSEAAVSEARIREYFEGNLCRCTGYASIVAAVRRAAAAPAGCAASGEAPC